MAGAGALSLQVFAMRVLRKLRYLLQRGVRAALLTAWAVVLSPFTIGAHVLLASGRIEPAARLAERAAARNPFTPGLNRLLAKVYLQQGDLPRAAAAAAAWARAHHKWDEFTYSIWSQYLLSVPGWKAVVDLPTPRAATDGTLDLTRLPAIPLGPAAGSGFDELATQLARTQTPPPARIVVRQDDAGALAIAAAISEWCGAEVELVAR